MYIADKFLLSIFILVDVKEESFAFSFTHSPSSNVRLPCSLHSSIAPGIPVDWTFGSLVINSSAVSNRHLILENGDLFITDSQLTDSGEYKCLLGNIELKRRLNVEGTQNYICA